MWESGGSEIGRAGGEGGMPGGGWQGCLLYRPLSRAAALVHRAQAQPWAGEPQLQNCRGDSGACMPTLPITEGTSTEMIRLTRRATISMLRSKPAAQGCNLFADCPLQLSRRVGLWQGMQAAAAAWGPGCKARSVKVCACCRATTHMPASPTMLCPAPSQNSLVPANSARNQGGIVKMPMMLVPAAGAGGSAAQHTLGGRAPGVVTKPTPRLQDEPSHWGTTAPPINSLVSMSARPSLPPQERTNEMPMPSVCGTAVVKVRPIV